MGKTYRRNDYNKKKNHRQENVDYMMMMVINPNVKAPSGAKDKRSGNKNKSWRHDDW